MKVTLYIDANRRRSYYGGDVAGTLRTPDGTALWGHVSSSPNWLERDLTSGGRGETLKLEYPDGFELVWLGPGDPRPWVVTPNIIEDASRQPYSDPCPDCGRTHMRGEHVRVMAPAPTPGENRVAWQGCVDCWVARTDPNRE